MTLNNQDLKEVAKRIREAILMPEGQAKYIKLETIAQFLDLVVEKDVEEEMKENEEFYNVL